MKRRSRSVAALVGLAACTSEPPKGGPGPGDPTGFGFEVVRDCPVEVGTICPFAGTGNSGFNGEGLPRLETWLSNPMSITFSPYGDPVIADWNNHKLRKIAPDGTVVTIMGTAFLGDGDFDLLDLSDGAPGTTVNLNHPTQQRYFSSGVLLSASWHTHKLRTWDPFTGLVRVLVGSAYGFMPEETDPAGRPQSAVGALLNQPRWVEIDSRGDVWIVDMRNERIRKLDLARFEIATVAGSGEKGVAGTEGCTSEDALETCFAFPNDMNPQPGGAIQLSADESVVYVADSEAHVLRALDVETGRVTVLAGAPGEAGDAVGDAADARFSFPAGLALDPVTNTLFVADTDNHRVKALDLETGIVTSVAGTGEPTCVGNSGGAELCPEQATGGDGGPATLATLYRPFGVDLDLDGNLVIADTFDNRFRVVYR